QGARLAVEHLVARGHRRIGFIQTQVPARWVFERRRGYQEGLINAGIEPEENLIYWMADGDDGCEPLEWIETYLRREKPTAVIAANFGAMRHLGRLVTKRGIKVPQHLSVVTFDQCWEMTPWTGGVRPTTVALPLKQMGERLVKMAAEVLAGHTLPGGAESIACSLLEGDSVLSI
ncbi:MAG TPA: substrate-binding domain-containing protein, partial [Tepidisphaeraceae bacterium]|nr:substrate-binding domain-containing protein [Tepidisphaeraceae bacterium]